MTEADARQNPQSAPDRPLLHDKPCRDGIGITADQFGENIPSYRRSARSPKRSPTTPAPPLLGALWIAARRVRGRGEMQLMLVGAVAAPQTTLATPADAADRVDRTTAALRQSPVFADPGVYC